MLPGVSIYYFVLRKFSDMRCMCRSASIRRAPSAPTAAPAAESLHASTAFARVTGANNQLQRLPLAGPPAAPTGTGTYRLEACVAWFSAARAVFSGFRSWVRPSA